MTLLNGTKGRAAVGLLAMALVLTACNNQGPAYSLPAPLYAAVIDMTTTLDFSPDKVTIKAGDVVLWRNQTAFTHTVTGDPSQLADPSRITLPDGAEPFGSGPIPPGEVFAYKFETPGIYRYVCKPHKNFDMAGTIIVTP